MNFSEVVLTILGILVLAFPAALWLIKLYAKTWVPELVKAEIRRQYSLSDESSGDRLSACKTLIRVLDEANNGIKSAFFSARLAISFAGVGDDAMFTSLLNSSFLMASKPASVLAGAYLPVFEQVIIAIKNSFRYSSGLLKQEIKPLRPWLPNNIENSLDSLIDLYSKEKLQESFESFARSVKARNVETQDVLNQFDRIEEEWNNERSKLEGEIKFELKRLLGVETPRKPVV